MNRSKTFGQVLSDLYYQAKGQPFAGIYMFQAPVFMPRYLDLIKDILVKDFSSFYDRGIPIDEDVDPLTGNKLFC